MNSRGSRSITIAFWACGIVSGIAGIGESMAQTVPPSAGTVLRGIETTVPVPEPPAVPQAPARPETAPLTPGAEGIFLGTLASYEITGAEDYDRVVRRLVDPLLNKTMSAADLERLKGEIAQVIQLQGGWFAVIRMEVDGTPTDRRLRIQISKPQVNELKLEVDPSLTAEVAAAVRGSLLDLVRNGEPLDLLALDARLRVLSEAYQVDLPVSVTASSRSDAVDVVVKVNPRTEAFLSRRAAGLSLNNYGARAYGQIQGVASGYVNGFTPGSILNAQIVGSQGTFYARTGYTFPLTQMGWHVGLWGSYLTLQSLTFNPPLTGSVLSAGGTLTRVHSFDRDVFWQADLSSTVSVARDSLAGFEIDKRVLTSMSTSHLFSRGPIDDLAFGQTMRAGWPLHQSRWLARLQATWGVLDLSGNQLAFLADQTGDAPYKSGVYGKLQGSAFASWQLAPRFPLAAEIKVAGQLAFRNLDPLEKYSISGPTGVRAYAFGDAVGDSGFNASLQLSSAPFENVMVFPFFDAGWVQTNNRPFGGVSTIPNSYWLAAAGVGATWQPWKNAIVNAAVAKSIPVVWLPPGLVSTMETAPGDFRGWLSLSLNF